jgi:hypothetical protein
MYLFSRIGFAGSCLLALFCFLTTVAHAQDVTASLTKASKLIEQGQAAQSIELIDRTLKSGNVPSNLAAKAMLMRAQAQEALDKHAYALADYNSALWMQDLSARDRTQAEEGRKRIMSKLGVGSKPAAASAKATAPKEETAAWGTEVREVPSEKRTGGIGAFFGNVFGGSDSEETRPAPRKVQPAPVRNASVTRSQQAAPQETPIISNIVAVNETQPSSASLDGQGQQEGEFAIQFSAVHSEDNALYEVERIDKRYGELLGGRTPSIKIRGTNDGGTLYKIIAAPYERGEGVATCELLKTKGVSCMLISR